MKNHHFLLYPVSRTKKSDLTRIKYNEVKMQKKIMKMGLCQEHQAYLKMEVRALQAAVRLSPSWRALGVKLMKQALHKTVLRLCLV